MDNIISFLTSKIFGFEFAFDINAIRVLLFCMVVGIYLRLLLSILCKQYWVRTYTQTLVFALLPSVGFLITNVISNSIALSLGMVGALSVVRFRTPVKNPLELVVYFLLITLGIVINVNQNLALNFIIFLSLVLSLVEVYSRITKGKSYEFFKESESYILNLVLKQPHNFEIQKNNLIHESQNDGLYMYTFKSKDIHYLDNIKDNITQENIVSYSIDK